MALHQALRQLSLCSLLKSPKKQGLFRENFIRLTENRLVIRRSYMTYELK